MANQEQKEQSNLQKDIEELSWEFVLELDNEKSKACNDQVFLEDENDLEELNDESVVQSSAELCHKQDNDHRLENIYRTDDLSFPNINDYHRGSTIIFDEDKLQNLKITAWSKAPRIKISKVKVLFKKFLHICAMPFVVLARLVYYLLSVLIYFLMNLANGIHRLFKSFLFLPWQILLALKASFEYLFGDLSWLNIKRVSLSPVASISRVDLPSRSYGRFKPLVIFICFAIILVLPIQAYLFYREGQEIKGKVMGVSMAGIEHLQNGGLSGSQLNFSLAEKEFGLAEQNFISAENNFKEIGALTANLAGIITEVKNAEKLLLIAKNSAQIGRHLSRVANIFSNLNVQIESASQPAAKDGTQSENQLGVINYELSSAFSEAQTVSQLFSELNLDNLDLGNRRIELENIKKQLPFMVSFLEQAREMFDVITIFLGIDAPKRWMLVFQNNSELRATGGFMGSYAIVDIKQGKITNIQVPGGGFYDLKGSLAVAVDAPYPFHLFSPIWQPWNANWFPDWPSSAQKIMWFYENSGGPTVDGVIAFTPNVLEKLLALTGEIDMPEYKIAVNSQNFVRLAQTEVEFNYDKKANTPKKFIGDLIPKVLAKTMELKNEKIVDILDIISESFKEKHLLVYFQDKQYEDKVASIGWAGELARTDGDYLSVVHTNIAGGKTDRVIDTNILHEVEILNNNMLLATVTVTKQHNGAPGDLFEGTTSTDYLRIYVPQGSKLVKADGFDPLPSGRIFQVAAENSKIKSDPDMTRLETNQRVDNESRTRINDEFGKTVFANWIVVNPGEQKTVKVSYILPFHYKQVRESPSQKKSAGFFSLLKQYFFKSERPLEKTAVNEYVYSLFIQKQAGTEHDTIISHFKVDPDWQIIKYLPQANDISLDESGLIYSADLLGDKYYGVLLKKSN